MTQDEIIEIARRVGFPIRHPDWQKAVEEFAALVEEKATAIEREACAKVCELGLPIATNLNALDDMEMWGEKFAKAIRARGEQA